MNQRRTATTPRITRIAFTVAAVAIISATAAISTAVAATSAGAPPSVLFRPGYNLCHAASLSAIRKAGKQQYKHGTLLNSVCTWQRPDLKAGVVLSTHPTKVGNALMRMFLAQSGKQHVTARRINIRSARKALLVTLPAGVPTERSKYLFAAYRNGVIQVNMTAPNSLPTTRLKAVLELIAR